jgi:hypothetical protein
MPRNQNHLLFLTRQSKAIAKEHDRRHKERAVWGVFQHSSGPSGGFVAREGWREDDGSTHYPTPYRDVRPLKEYKRQSDADKDANRRTFG